MLRNWIAPRAKTFSGLRKVQAPSNRRFLDVERLEERALFAVTALGNTAPEQFVTGLYADILHRQPQASESQIWSLALDNGATPGQTVRGFIDSAEYRTDLIDQAYQHYLHRNPEPAGLSYWLNQMQSGVSYQSFLVNVLSSNEYRADHRGSWITALYSDVLNRPADARGFATWQNTNASQPPVVVAHGFVFGAEFETREVAAAYQSLLGRAPDPAGAGEWLTALQQGLSAEQLSVLIGSSPEAIARQASLSTATYFASSQVSGSPAVKLVVPYFSSTSTPTVAINASPSTYTGAVWIDVDLHHDGSFTDPGDAGQTSGSITNQSNQLSLNSLPNGIYAIRARISGPNNQILVSPMMTIDVNTNEGFIGSQTLLNLYSDYTSAMTTHGSLPNSFFARSAHPENFDAQNRVGMNVHATAGQNLSGLAADLTNLGMNVMQVNTAQQMVIGYIPMSMISQLMTLPNLSSVTPIYRPLVYTGSVTSQGDALIKANTFRAQQGVSGQDLAVGILSDSINVFDGGIAQSASTGDLNPNNIVIVKDGPDGSSDEGRAMAEIVSDVAPSSDIAFYSGAFFPQDMAQGIDLMSVVPARLVVDDIGYPDEPMFNDGIIAQAVDRLAAKGVFYASAAGNDGNGAFLTNWRGTSATIGSGNDSVSGTFLDLGGGSPLQTFTLDTNNFISIDTQWDNAFLEGGTIFPNFQVQTQVNVYITTADGSKILGVFNDDTLNTGEALQLAQFFNDGSFGTNQFALAFQLAQGPAPTELRWVNFADTGIDIHALHQGGPAIFGHPVATGAIAVAAVPWFAPNTAEPFTSVGGDIPILFDTSGNRLSTPDIRVKPQVAGPDGVSISFDLDGSNTFFGTSASAPHVAAAAALLLRRFPTLTPSQIAQHLEATALSLNTPGVDVTGAGLIQVVPFGAGGGAGGGGSGGSGGTGGGSTGGGSTGGGSTGGGIGTVTNPVIFGQSSDQATNLGVLTGTESFSSAIVKQANGLDGNQWATWTAGQSGTYSATLNYSIPGGDLNFKLYALNAQHILQQLAAGTNLNVSSQMLSAPVSAGETLYLWVYGYNHSQGDFTLTVSLG
jgi:hypothetical protein